VTITPSGDWLLPSIYGEGVLNVHKGIKNLNKTSKHGSASGGFNGMILAWMADLPVNYKRMLDQNIDIM